MSILRHIGIKREETWGIKEVGANDFFLPFISETLTPNIEEILSAAQRGIVDEPKSYQGSRAFAGDVVMEVHPASLGHILRSAIGVPTGPVKAGAIVLTLEDCEDKWDEAAGVNPGVISEVDPVDKKKGKNAVKLIVTAGVAAGEILATELIDEIDMHLDTGLKIWVKCDKACADGDLQILLGTDPGCATTPKAVNIPILEAGVYKECTIDLTDAPAAVVSVGIKMVVDKTECTIRLDDLRRVGAYTAKDAEKWEFVPRQDDFHADCSLCPYTIEVHRGQAAADQAFRYLGAIVNTLALSFGTGDKILKATMGILAKDWLRIPKTGVDMEVTDPFIWKQARIGIGAALTQNLDIESFGTNQDNHCVPFYSLNKSDLARRFYRDTFRDMPVNFVIDFVDQVEFDKFILGSEQAFQLKFEGAEIESGFNYTLQIDMPKVRYLTYPINVGGPGRIGCAVTGKAKYDATAGIEYPIKFTLINKETAY
ncbi:hypothetical protein ES708_18421 [subsurface metagenome]